MPPYAHVFSQLALKTLQQSAEDAKAKAVTLQDSADDYRRRAVHTKQVAAMTRLTELSVAELDAATEASKSLVKGTNDTKHSNVGKVRLPMPMLQPHLPPRPPPFRR